MSKSTAMKYRMMNIAWNRVGNRVWDHMRNGFIAPMDYAQGYALALPQLIDGVSKKSR